MKRIIFGVFLFLLFLFLYQIPLTLTPSYAQTSGTCSTRNTRAVVQDGLTSTISIDINNNLVTSSGVCIIDPKAAFAPYKIPSYDDLKSLYFDQSKLPRSGANQQQLYTLSDNPSTIDLASRDKIYFVDGNLNITSPSTITGNQTGIIFVNGTLSIGPLPSTKLQGNNDSGLVFIVKRNVNIDQSVTQVDAVIISEGIIYTAGANCSSSSPVPTNKLVINGSLISLKQPPADDPNASYIQFCRTLDRAIANNNSTTPAEQINHQVKYLVILRNLMSDTFQRWSEIP